MPYIDKALRNNVDEELKALNKKLEEATAGEINYVVTSILKAHLSANLRYGEINELIGVLECAKMELYRRVAGPFEDEKAKENGDVY